MTVLSADVSVWMDGCQGKFHGSRLRNAQGGGPLTGVERPQEAMDSVAVQAAVHAIGGGQGRESLFPPLGDS